MYMPVLVGTFLAVCVVGNLLMQPGICAAARSREDEERIQKLLQDDPRYSKWAKQPPGEAKDA